MDKASKVLGNLTAPPPQLPIGYQRFSYNPLLVAKEIELDSYLAHLALLEPDCLMFVPNQLLVKESVGLVLPPIVHSILEEHNDHIAHVLLILSDSPESKSDPPILVVQESPSPIPARLGGNHMIPPPSSYVVSLDWGTLTAFRLPSYVPF